MNDEQTMRPPEMIDPSRPWLLREVDPLGNETFSIRVFFWAMRGPSYFGPFFSEAHAQRFYDEAPRVVGEMTVELANLAQTIDDDFDDDDEVSSIELTGEA